MVKVGDVVLVITNNDTDGKPCSFFDHLPAYGNVVHVSNNSNKIEVRIGYFYQELKPNQWVKKDEDLRIEDFI
jgi:hypothetical protein